MNAKRFLSIIFVLIASLSVLFACTSDNNTEEQPPCEHAQTEVKVENEVAASCTTNGKLQEVTSCTLCGIELSREDKTLYAFGHDMGSYVSDKNATCTVDGTKTRACKNGCGYKETVTEPNTAKGHVGTNLISSNTETCGGKPVGELRCAECNEFMSNYGHKYVKTVVQPTCTKEGEIRNTCSDCGDVQIEKIAIIDHVFSAWETTVAPTCHNKGIAVSVCIVCNDEKTEKSINEIPHSYDSVLVGNELVFTCRECQDTKTEIVEKEVFTISFEENGGAVLSDMIVDSGALPDLPLPVFDGYVFVGWYYNEGLTELYSGAAIHENTTFYAKWQKLDTLSDKEDIVRGAPLDYTFNIICSSEINENNIDSFIQIKTLSGESMNVRAESLGNGMYEIACDEYECGTNYFVTLLDGASFDDRDTNALWIITEGSRDNLLQLKSDAIKYSLNHIYALSETADGVVIVTYDDILDEGNTVAFYEDDMNAYRFGGKVLSKSHSNSYYTYILELYEIDRLFDYCELSHSTAIDFDDAELNHALREELAAAFLASEVYDQYVRAVSALSSKYGSKLGDPTFNIQFFPKNEIFTIKLSVSAQTDTGIVFTMDYFIDLEFEVDFTIDGKDSTLVLVTDMTNRAQLDIDGIHAFGSSARSRLLAEYREMFDMMKEKNALIDPKTESGNVESNEFHIATIPMKTGLVTVYLDLSANVEFAMMGGVSAELIHTLHSEIGIRGGNHYSDYEAKLVSINGCAYTGIDFYGGIGVALNVGFCGLTGYIKGNIGLHGELVGAAVLSITENSSYALGDYKFDSEVLINAQVGVKYEVNILGFKKTYLDKSFTAAEGGFPFIEMGSSEIALHFIDNSHSTPQDAMRLGDISCGSPEVNMSRKVNTQILMLNLEKFVSNIKDVPCEYQIVYGKSDAENSTITKDGYLIVSCSGKFTICISVKYGDVLEKQIYVTGNAVHNYQTETVRDDLRRSDATCSQRATYYYSCGCGLVDYNKYFEYGDLAPHSMKSYYSYDENQHWIECSNSQCTYKEESTIKEHTLEKIISGNYKASDADCYSPATYYYYCSECQNIPGTTFEHGNPLGHSYADNFTCHDRLCTRCYDYVDKASTYHRDSCGTCLDCKKPLYYFQYELQSDNTYAVTGTYTKYDEQDAQVDYSSVGIPEFYNGRTVTAIKERAFTNVSNISKLILPDTIKTLGYEAFYRCESLTEIEINGDINVIERSTFAYCTGLKKVVLGNGIKKLCNNAFGGCLSLESIVIPGSLKTIEDFAFLIDGAPEITVYYTGTEAEWSALMTAHNNTAGLEDLKNATVICNAVVEE